MKHRVIKLLQLAFCCSAFCMLSISQKIEVAYQAGFTVKAAVRPPCKTLAPFSCAISEAICTNFGTLIGDVNL